MTKKATIRIEISDENMITTQFEGNLDAANMLLAFSMITQKLLTGQFKQQQHSITGDFKAESIHDRMNRK